MNAPSTTTMRFAFERATTDCPKTQRTRLYAMVRSAMNRKIGLTFRKTGWNVGHGGRR